MFAPHRFAAPSPITKGITMRSIRRLATIVFTVVILVPLCAQFSIVRAQITMPTLFDEHGNSSSPTYPPPASSYVPDELIIKFRPGALLYSALCYECPGPASASQEVIEMQPVAPSPDPSCRRSLMAQRFPVDAGLLRSSSLAAAIRMFGGTVLRRITIANPCRDTLSLARRGDTLRMDDFNWMTLELGNDTSVINAALWLTINFQDQIELAEPNYYMAPLGTPSDYYFNNAPFQAGLEIIGMSTAWNYAVGSPDVRVGVIDDGIDYLHCDLGGRLGAKVKDGRNYVDSAMNVRDFALHGTPCAGIIGAYTNRQSCIGATPSSGAGIAGGWGPDNGSGTDTPGASLWAYAFVSNYPGNAARAIAAIREASVYGIQGGYGDAMHILNFSGKLGLNDDDEGKLYSGSLESAVNTAYEHGVSFVAARGNEGNQTPEYPACFAGSWVTSVGGSQRNGNRHRQSSYGQGMDVISPYGGKNYNPPEQEKTVFTTAHTGRNGEDAGKHDYFDGTSAAAPHVSGVMALLRSYLPAALDPEDYEGMVEASANDRNPNTSPNEPFYLFSYDEHTGWGHLRADRLFTMLGEERYTISNFTVTDPLIFGQWSEEFEYYFSNQQETNKPLPSGTYRVRRREVSSRFDLREHGSWSPKHELYVWGRGGSKATGGFSAANPNYQNRWTEVTSGEGGNGFTAGILHGGSDLCVARTFQYDIQRFNRQTGKMEYLGRFPSDEELAFHITVFAVPLVTSVRAGDREEETPECSIAPNPAGGEAGLTYTLRNPGRVRITVLNALGQEVTGYPVHQREAGRYELQLNLADIPPGVYYCRVEAGDRVAVRPLIIAR